MGCPVTAIFPPWMRLAARRPTRREQVLRRALGEQHEEFAKVYARCRGAETKATFLTDQLTERTEQRDACGAALLEATTEVDRLRGLVAAARTFLPALVADAPDQPDLEVAQQEMRVWLEGAAAVSAAGAEVARG